MTIARSFKDATIDAVHVCTPNASHFQMSKDALLAGKHVLWRKAVICIRRGSTRACRFGAGSGKLRNCVCHNLRYYPMVQQMRRMREAGDLGQVHIVQGTYSQDWLFFDTDWNWRVDAASSGPLRAMGDIGSHWFDMAEHVTGLRVRSLCTDLQTYYPVRKRPKHSVETFAGKLSTADAEVEEIPVSTEDFGAVPFSHGRSGPWQHDRQPGIRRPEEPSQH